MPSALGIHIRQITRAYVCYNYYINTSYDIIKCLNESIVSDCILNESIVYYLRASYNCAAHEDGCHAAHEI